MKEKVLFDSIPEWIANLPENSTLSWDLSADQERLPGIDVSRWQGLWDWKASKAAGVKFAFVRAGSCTYTSGTCYEDSQYPENTEGAHQANMPIGYYWYFRPNHSPTAQADYFSNLCLMGEFVIPPVADIENDGGLSPAKYADSIKAFLDRIEKLTGYKPIIYTSASKWAKVEPRPYWGEYDLWVAHWEASTPLLPEAWKHWWFWQHSSKGIAADLGGLGSSKYVDLNWFNGDEKDFAAYLGVGQPDLPKSIGVKVDIEGVKYRGHIDRVD